MKPLALFLLAVVALWWFCYPEPTRTIPEQFTEIQLMKIRKGNRQYGNFPKTMVGNVVTWHTSYGKVEVKL